MRCVFLLIPCLLAGCVARNPTQSKPLPDRFDSRWNAAEDCTDQQSANDQNGGGPHGNFGACGENAQNTCPNWGSENQIISGCLQAMWDEGPGEPFSAHGHYINMSSTTYTRVACGFSSSGSGVWSNQNFSP